MIYLDNAATTALHESVLERMLPYFGVDFGNPGSVHAAGRKALHAVMDARATVAECLGCMPRQIIFTSGGTEADNQALATGAEFGRRAHRMRMVASSIEHPAVLRALDYWEAQGFTITLVNPDGTGVVSARAIEAVLDDDVCLVSVMSANNETGVLQPISEIAQAAHAAGALFHTDAVQAAGHVRLNAEASGIDVLSISAHKFHGPKGVGALVCRTCEGADPLIYGGGQERGRRSGTENVPGIVGLATALEEACKTMEEDAARVRGLRDCFEARLEQIEGAYVVGKAAPRVPGISNVCFGGFDHQTLIPLLDARGVCASAGSACSAGAVKTSHVLRAMGISEPLAKGSVRFSLSADTTQEDVDAAAVAMREIMASLKR
ncbi:cysteine desulfurase family protein [uncultured Slackia sp.]|uniref:cysteine desulfurase family protein n=1 Tax=uncultured Slackia sp. TaxID=665903 RepID=UPI0025D6ADC0|nr:cysteine desulfurase family protein [uncultured Slackia sp.]